MDGMDVVKTMEKLGRENGKPKAEVTIGDCGQIVYQAAKLHHMKGNVPQTAGLVAELSRCLFI